MSEQSVHQKRTIITAWIWFIILLLVTLGLEWVMEPHPHFGIDGSQWFYAWYGFLSCLAIIVISKILGVILKRPENFYGEDR